MKRIILCLLFLCCSTYKVVGQVHHTNLIIQINDKLILEGLQNIYITTDQAELKKIYVDYVPGDLILADSVYNLLSSEKIEGFKLHFSYVTHGNRKSENANFHVGLSKNVFSLPYLILNVYDFRDRKYRNWYQHLTKENFLVERIFPNSGIYIRRN